MARIGVDDGVVQVEAHAAY
uniref:Uncharacterized protein n=1 Tax=Plectus sambesii TaxID=2011161 RepID=A0A914UNV0_9BILA